MSAVAERVRAAVTGPDATACDHITDPAQPVAVHLDAPTALLCADCFSAGFTARQELSDGSCDVCRSEPATQPVLLQVNGQLVACGQVCEACGADQSLFA